MLRGGNWNNDTNAGVFAANLNNEPSNANGNVGFRCALRSSGGRETRDVLACGKSLHSWSGHAEPSDLSQGTSGSTPVADRVWRREIASYPRPEQSTADTSATACPEPAYSY